MPYEVYSLETDESHGTFETLSEARGCVSYDRIQAAYEIQKVDAEGNFLARGEHRDDSHDFDPENIYNLPCIRQSIAEDRRLRRGATPSALATLRRNTGIRLGLS